MRRCRQRDVLNQQARHNMPCLKRGSARHSARARDGAAAPGAPRRRRSHHIHRCGREARSNHVTGASNRWHKERQREQRAARCPPRAKERRRQQRWLKECYSINQHRRRPRARIEEPNITREPGRRMAAHHMEGAPTAARVVITAHACCRLYSKKRRRHNGGAKGTQCTKRKRHVKQAAARRCAPTACYVKPPINAW